MRTSIVATLLRSAAIAGMLTCGLSGFAEAYSGSPSPDIRRPLQSSAAFADSAKLTRDGVVAMLRAADTTHRANFSGRDLSGLDLSGLDFSRVNLAHANLQKTSFEHARMFAADLDSADARHADFNGAVLDLGVMRGTDLRGATLRGASLFAVIMIGANLSDADLTGARVLVAAPGAQFVRTNFTHADMGADPRNQPMGVMRSDLSGADLSGADLTGANLRKVKFQRANLSGANLTAADLTFADLDDTNFHGITGRDTIKGLDQALHVDNARFDPK